VGIDFYLLACGAASNIVLDKNGHPWPPVVLADQFKCFQVSEVSSRKGVMVASSDVSSEVFIGGYKASVFTKE